MQSVLIAAVAIATSSCAGKGSDARPARGRHNASIVVAWSRTRRQSPEAVAADHRGVVITGDDEVDALDAHGQTLWSVPLPGASFDAPLLTPDTVVVPASRFEASGDTGACVALDRASGAVRWRFALAHTGAVAVTRSGSRVLCATRDGWVVALDLTTGAVDWKMSIAPGSRPGTASISDETALTVDDATGIVAFVDQVMGHWRLELLDVNTGARRGSGDLGAGDPPSAPVGLGAGRIGLAAASPAEVLVYDLRSEHLVTRVPLSAPAGFDPASVPLWTAGLFVVAGRAGNISAVDVARRRVRWTAASADPILGSHPVRVGDDVLLANWTLRALAFRLSDGKVVARPPDPGGVVGTVGGPGGAAVVAGRKDGFGRIEGWATG
jgi:outer membrane protein assembly factor BamB